MQHRGGGDGAQPEADVGDRAQVRPARHPAVHRQHLGEQRTAHRRAAPVGGGQQAGQHGERRQVAHQHVPDRAQPLRHQQHHQHRLRPVPVGQPARRHARRQSDRPATVSTTPTCATPKPRMRVKNSTDRVIVRPLPTVLTRVITDSRRSTGSWGSSRANRLGAWLGDAASSAASSVAVMTRSDRVRNERGIDLARA
ncbi:hypothetical protein KCH_17240 [Kitasatospora cheerisanensis KCTC 2395]|uniref:Uncharacterized protein n=1 Tax=Kitasatospora cheerisanensis KCTC 2395 TaxID=1348663 RepID=A0A066Z844_9ACTN|nr:hypothetical protein KCH_17240 [Kitasatospora cheerisanensis KCTC 2395]